MQTSDLNTWAGSILFAAFVHGLLFMQWGAQLGLGEPEHETYSQTTRLDFSIKEPYMPEVKPVQEIKPVVKKVEKKKPKKIIPQEVARVVEPEPVVEEVADIQPQAAMLPPPSNAALLAQQREQYMQQLMSHIEKYKYYPGAARRRGIEGEVNIRFRLCHDGDVEDLEIDSDYSILKQAANEAVRSALPLPQPPEDLGFSRQFVFNMVYRLN